MVWLDLYRITPASAARLCRVRLHAIVRRYFDIHAISTKVVEQGL